MSVEVRDNTDDKRFEAWIDGELCGIAEYRLRPGEIVFTHTEVLREGQGVGSELARQALDAVRAKGGLKVVPLCPFIKAWIDEHPDYQDLVR
ncbi:MAG: GNAT family N-acetyltransferase [Nocardioides sp.]